MKRFRFPGMYELVIFVCGSMSQYPVHINIQNVGQTCESGRNCYIKTATYRNFEHQNLDSYCIFATLVLISTSVCKFS